MNYMVSMSWTSFWYIFIACCALALIFISIMVIKVIMLVNLNNKHTFHDANDAKTKVHDAFTDSSVPEINIESKRYSLDFKKENINIYLINMKKNADRFNHFLDMYRNSDLNGIRFFRLEAIDGSKVVLTDFITKKALDEISYAEKHGHRTKHYQLSRGGVGCYLSHIMIYRHMLTTDNYYSFIFEDDVVMDKDIYIKTSEYLDVVPADWDVLLLGCHCISCVKEKQYSKIKRFFFTHGMVFNRKGVIKVLNFLNEILIEQQIDAVLSDMAEKNMINIYCLNNAIAKQNSSFQTTIQIPLKEQPGVDPYATVEGRVKS